LKIFISAAEPSGDLIAAEVMEYLPPETQYLGVGGAEMEQRGLQSLFPLEELSVMGFWEILPRAANLLKRIRETVDVISREQPDVVLTVDAYSFHSRLARQLRKKGYGGRLCHYVSPAVWAWKEGRAKALAQLYDDVYCLFPFELPYFKGYPINAKFVGHPGAFRIYDRDPTFRARYQLSDAPIFLVLPGSRHQEIDRLYDPFLQTYQVLKKTIPDLQLVVPTLPHLEEKIKEINARNALSPTLMTSTIDRFHSFQEAQLGGAALAASGTVALELALNKVPCVIGYKTSALTYGVAKRLVQVPYVTVLNIMAKKAVIPEFLQNDCTPDNLAAALLPYLQGQKRPHLMADMEKHTEALKHPSGLKPQEIVARELRGVGHRVE
jgi:lipid-A-disaccharide synthase